MTNETRKYTDEEIKEVFKNTKKTAEFEVHDIEYMHYELYPDWYLVRTTNGGNYLFQVSVKDNHKNAFTNPRNYKPYHRICKTKVK